MLEAVQTDAGGGGLHPLEGHRAQRPQPANIFIDHQQSIKLGDFGHQLTPLTAHHTLASPLAWLTYRCWAAVLWCRGWRC